MSHETLRPEASESPEKAEGRKRLQETIDDLEKRIASYKGFLEQFNGKTGTEGGGESEKVMEEEIARLTRELSALKEAQNL